MAVAEAESEAEAESRLPTPEVETERLPTPEVTPSRARAIPRVLREASVEAQILDVPIHRRRTPDWEASAVAGTTGPDGVVSVVRLSDLAEVARVWEEQVSEGRLFVPHSRPADPGTAAQVRIFPPLSTFPYSASGIVIEAGYPDDGPQGLWIALDPLPPDTRRALESAWSTCQERKKRERRPRFWPFGRRRKHA